MCLLPWSTSPIVPTSACRLSEPGPIWPAELWPQNNIPVGGGGVAGRGGGANEEDSTQPPEEILIVWGLPWVLLIKKKIYLNANVYWGWAGLVRSREASRP